MKLSKIFAAILLAATVSDGAEVTETKTPTGPSGTVTLNNNVALSNKTVDETTNTLKGVYAASSILRARDYGILPTNTDVQNDTGFASLKTKLQSSATTVWRVIFEPGAYVYTNNRWLFNVRNAIIDAYGASFQSTSASAANGDKVPLNVGEYFDDSGDVAGVPTTLANGYLFNTAAAGDTSITTTTAANAGNFSVGMRILLSGYDQQQSGYPPNLRYFEVKTVKTVNAGTGVVTFTSQLQNAYDSRWWDTANYGGSALAWGAPRILSIERANYNQAKLLWFRGAKFLASSVSPSVDQLAPTADLVIYEDVQGVAVTASESDNTQIIRSKFVGDSSGGDKLVGRLDITDSLFDGNPLATVTTFNDCVGCNYLAFTRTTIRGGNINVGARHLSVRDTEITAPAAAFAGIGIGNNGNPTTTALVEGSTIYGSGLSFGFSNAASPGNALVVGAVSGNTIQLTWDATAKTVADQIDYGMVITDAAAGLSCTITGIFLTGGNTLNITGCGSAPTVGHTFNYYDVIAKYDGGGNSTPGEAIPFWRALPVLSSAYSAAPVFTGITTVDQLNFSPTSSNNFITNNSNNLRFYRGNVNYMYLDGFGLQMLVPIYGAPLTLGNAVTVSGGDINLGVSNGSSVTNVGTGSTTGAVTIGGGSDGVVINSSASGYVKNTALISTGTKFTTTACSISATSGGAAAGTFTLGANACTAVITINGATGLTAPTGWSCQAHDRTAPTILIGGESASSATTASFTIPAGAGATDVISYSCTGF